MVLATTEPANRASQAVLERVGFLRVADRGDLWAYELTTLPTDPRTGPASPGASAAAVGGRDRGGEGVGVAAGGPAGGLVAEALADPVLHAAEHSLTW